MKFKECVLNIFLYYLNSSNKHRVKVEIKNITRLICLARISHLQFLPCYKRNIKFVLEICLDPCMLITCSPKMSSNFRVTPKLVSMQFN